MSRLSLPTEALKTRLAGILKQKTAIIFIGNELRQDDGAAVRAGRRVRASRPDLKIFQADSNPEDVVEDVIAFKPECALIVDAADFRAAPGELRFLRRADIDSSRVSAHRVPPGLLMAIFESEGIKPYLLGIQIAGAGEGPVMSPPVRRAARGLAGFLRRSV